MMIFLKNQRRYALTIVRGKPLDLAPSVLYKIQKGYSGAKEKVWQYRITNWMSYV